MRVKPYYGIDCHNQNARIGHHAFQIPFPTPLSKSESQSRSSTGNAGIRVACPDCRHVYAYTRSHVHYSLTQTPDLFAEPPDPTLLVVEFPCGDPACDIRVTLYTPKKPDESRSDVLARLAKSIFHIGCSANQNHTPHFPTDARLFHRVEELDYCPF